MKCIVLPIVLFVTASPAFFTFASSLPPLACTVLILIRTYAKPRRLCLRITLRFTPRRPRFLCLLSSRPCRPGGTRWARGCRLTTRRLAARRLTARLATRQLGCTPARRRPRWGTKGGTPSNTARWGSVGRRHARSLSTHTSCPTPDTLLRQRPLLHSLPRRACCRTLLRRRRGGGGRGGRGVDQGGGGGTFH
jgi:hypothetical protein